MSRLRRPARGFTLLEVTLATAIGGMVILVALSLLVSMEKLERPLAIRQQELADLHRTRTVIQRAISSLVMSDTTAPVNPNARRPTSSNTSEQSTDEKGKSAFEATAEATASKQQQQQRPPARLLLEADQTDELKALLQTVGVPVDSAAGIQRLEVVVDSPPIAPNFRAELGDAIAAAYSRNSSSSSSSSSSTGSSSTQGGNNLGTGSGSGGSGGASASGARSSRLAGRTGNRKSLSLGGKAGNSSSPTGSLRGAFELRPMQSADNQFERRAGKPVLYELWWTPLPAAKDTSKQSAVTNAPVAAKEDDPRTLEAWGEPVLLANNLVKCRWKLFSSGEQRTAHNAVWERELPAYVEFEIQTKTGLYENWMFEVGWTKGAELATKEPAAGEGALSGPGGANGQAGGGPQNGQGGPAGIPPQGPNHGGVNVPPPSGGNGGGPRYDTIPTKPPK